MESNNKTQSGGADRMINLYEVTQSDRKLDCECLEGYDSNDSFICERCEVEENTITYYAAEFDGETSGEARTLDIPDGTNEFILHDFIVNNDPDNNNELNYSITELTFGACPGAGGHVTEEYKNVDDSNDNPSEDRNTSQVGNLGSWTSDDNLELNTSGDADGVADCTKHAVLLQIKYNVYTNNQRNATRGTTLTTYSDADKGIPVRKYVIADPKYIPVTFGKILPNTYMGKTVVPLEDFNSSSYVLLSESGDLCSQLLTDVYRPEVGCSSCDGCHYGMTPDNDFNKEHEMYMKTETKKVFGNEDIAEDFCAFTWKCSGDPDSCYAELSIIEGENVPDDRTHAKCVSDCCEARAQGQESDDTCPPPTHTETTEVPTGTQTENSYFYWPIHEITMHIDCDTCRDKFVTDCDPYTETDTGVVAYIVTDGENQTSDDFESFYAYATNNCNKYEVMFYGHSSMGYEPLTMLNEKNVIEPSEWVSGDWDGKSTILDNPDDPFLVNARNDGDCGCDTYDDCRIDINNILNTRNRQETETFMKSLSEKAYGVDDSELPVGKYCGWKWGCVGGGSDCTPLLSIAHFGDNNADDRTREECKADCPGASTSHTISDPHIKTFFGETYEI